MKTKKKILLIIDKLSYGGAEKVFFELAKEMSKRDNFDIVLLSLNKSKDLYHSTEISIMHPPKNIYEFYHFWRYWGVYKIIKQQNPDIIHTSMASADWLAGIYNLFCKNKIIISTIHTYQQIRFHKIRLKHKIHFKLLSFLYNRINKVICVSDDLCNYTSEKFNIPRHALATIYNGLENNSDFPVFEKTKRFKGNLLYIGSIRPVKNLKMLLRVLAALPNEFNLTIIGTGSDKAELKEYAENLGLSNRIKILGFKYNVCKLIPEYDILIIPSLHESFSLTALEGLTAGIPTIATNAGGIRELFGSELNDLLFDPHDKDELLNKILHISDNYLEYIERVRKLKNKFLEFSVSNMALKYEKLYAELLSESGELNQ